jgi:hypothetical protein
MTQNKNLSNNIKFLIKNETLIDCSKVSVRLSKIFGAGLGAFANTFIKKDDIVEYGLVKLVDCDGHNNPYLFTWSEDKTKWAYASGCATFYNSKIDSNTHVIRDFEKLTYKIIAKRNIEKGEELTHTYKSLKWRKCFKTLN